MIQIASSTPVAAQYAALELTGLALTRQGPGAATLNLPPAQDVALNFVSVLRGDYTLRLRLFEAAGAERAVIRRCGRGPLRVDEEGEIVLADTFIDAGSDAAVAINAPLARVETERVTIAGELASQEVELSDTIVTGRVIAQERFRGCVRYSLVGFGSQTPRRHRVLETDASGRPIRAPFESRDRRDPAWLKLDPAGDTRILTGASDGGEIGAYGAARLGALFAGVERRLLEHTPAGQKTGFVMRS
jgi:hypothetical protein